MGNSWTKLPKSAKKGRILVKKVANSKIGTRAAELIRGGIVAALLPVFFLYVFLDKPDYKIANATSGVIVPMARAAGDLFTWPLRAVGNMADGIRELSNARAENEELRARLDNALRNQNECVILSAENQKMSRQIDMANGFYQKTIMARISHDFSAFSHKNFIISKGTIHGVQNGMAVVSSDGFLAGIVIDAHSDFARARGIEDAKSSVPVRVAGTGVYGFLTGMGNASPLFELFSDQEFEPAIGIKLLSSGIKGNLPNGIPIGTVIRVGKKSAYVKLGAPAGKIHDVMVLEFDGKGGYK